MDNIIMEIISVIAALVLGPLWYTEMTKRRKAETELALEKARRPLEDINKELEAMEPLREYDPHEHPIPAYMYDYISPDREPDAVGGGTDDTPDDISTKKGSGGDGSGLQ